MKQGYIKAKQISSGNLTSPNKVIKSDGNGGSMYGDIVNSGSTFPSSGNTNEIFYHTTKNQLFTYDNIRSKWLSIFRYTYNMDKATIDKSISSYLNNGSTTQSSTVGILMPYDGTILSVTISNITTIVNRTIELRLNNSLTNRIVLTFNNSNILLDNNVNLNFNQGDILHGYSPSNDVDDINNLILTIIVANR